MMSRLPERLTLFYWGILLLIIAAGLFFLGVILSLVGLEWSVLSSSRLFTLLGVALIAADLILLFPWKRSHLQRPRHLDAPADLTSQATVVLTAYNDEASIGRAVRDFQANPRVRRVIVVDNGSSDRTAGVATEAGATVVREEAPGYGRCVYRCLSEAVRRDDTGFVVLCEGDRTFRAADIHKLFAFIPHADIVNGTRIVEQLRDESTQLTTFMFYGNFFVGKLIELKHLGKGTFTDAGTTYKMIRTEVLPDVLAHLDPRVNLEFNAHFMDTVLKLGLAMVECPVTFHARVGASKGGNTGNLRAIRVGLRMILGLTFGWRILT